MYYSINVLSFIAANSCLGVYRLRRLDYFTCIQMIFYNQRLYAGAIRIQSTIRTVEQAVDVKKKHPKGFVNVWGIRY